MNAHVYEANARPMCCYAVVGENAISLPTQSYSKGMVS